MVLLGSEIKIFIYAYDNPRIYHFDQMFLCHVVLICSKAHYVSKDTCINDIEVNTTLSCTTELFPTVLTDAFWFNLPARLCFAIVQSQYL